ncbi:MAG: hypothetical protein Q9227_007487 [Pyrenula ochraceoflavens]
MSDSTPWSKDASSLLLDLHTRTNDLLSDPINPQKYIERAKLYRRLDYHDLAAADAYKALTLVEKLLDPCDEDFVESHNTNLVGDSDGTSTACGPDEQQRIGSFRYPALRFLILSLVEIGCLQDAQRFLLQMQETEAVQEDAEISTVAYRLKDAKISLLPNAGFVRREIYPWNQHEPNRYGAQTNLELNTVLQAVAPELEVRTTMLPILQSSNAVLNRTNDSVIPSSRLQLGLFAKTDLGPGQKILSELSPLTATTASDSSLCDCCQTPLPSLNSLCPPVACSSCQDTVFCSSRCYEIAQSKYHPAVCGNDSGLDQIGRSGNQSERSDNLYLLLLARTIAMAETQCAHPLDLPEVRYLWGDFGSPDGTLALPFSFHFNVVMPQQILEAMQETTDNATFPFSTSSLSHYEPWVFNTLYAKFRGVASAKQSTWDGAPEVSAVHPLWCLANHSCAPNVRWNWQGSIEFHVRQSDELVESEIDEEEGQWPGIKAGEEILNHYCDVKLPVKERREWALGALGGACQCRRCVSESRKEDLSIQEMR